MKTLGLTLVVATLAACGVLPGVAQGDSEPAANDAVDSQIQGYTPRQSDGPIFQIMLAEIAATRGDLATAVESYRIAALQSADPAVAERATSLAIELQQWDIASQIGEHWATLVPDDPRVQQLLIGVYVRAADAVQAANTLERVMDMSGQSFDAGVTSMLAVLKQHADSELAVEVAEVLAERNPDSGMAFYVLGQLRMDRSDWDGALSALDRSIALQPNFGRAQIARAEVQRQRGEMEDGVDRLQRFVDVNPDDIAAKQGLVQMLVATGRDERALEVLDKVYDSHPDQALLAYNLGLLALELEAFERARKFFERAVSLESDRADGHYFLGRISEYLVEHADAIAHYDRVTTGVNVFDAALRAAELAGRSQSLEAGLDRLHSLRGLASDVGVARIALSESGLYQHYEDFDGARASLDSALESYPNDNRLRYARGLLLSRLGDFRGFEREMREILADEPDNAQALNALGYGLVERNAQLDEAAELIGRAIALEPDDPAIIDSQGWLYFRLGELDKAREYLERAFALMQDSEIAAHLIEVYWELGDRNAARELYEKARLADPNSTILQSLVDRLPVLGGDS